MFEEKRFENKVIWIASKRDETLIFELKSWIDLRKSCPWNYFSVWFCKKFVFRVSSEYKMNRRNQIEMLSKSRQLLRLMNLGQKTQFQIGRMKIPNFVMFTLLSAPLCYSIVTESITAYEIGLNFKEGSSGFLILLGTVQMMLIYFCLVSDNQTIIEMMDLIEGVVNRSKKNFIKFKVFSKFS